ncbi:MAG: hypothetical protein U0573_03985 [Phycisphaerales bacterium]|nr:hypothetical protein [Planctomycetota bacterium]
MTKLAGFAGTLVVATSALGVGYSVDSGSYVQGFAFGSNTQALYMGFNFTPATWTAFVGSFPRTTVTPSGLTMVIDDLYTSYWSGGPAVQAAARGKMYFTPTVPNLSYTFNGFMPVVQLGSPSSMSAAADVYLRENFPHGPYQYSNNVAYSGPCALWSPASPQFGTQTGDLIQGQQYELSWDFSLTMAHGGDPTADYRVKTKNGPYFQLLLYQRPCPGDLTGDGYVDDSDFAVFALAYNLLDCADPLMPPGCPSDLNHDGYVDDADFVLFADAYGQLLCP